MLEKGKMRSCLAIEANGKPNIFIAIELKYKFKKRSSF